MASETRSRVVSATRELPPRTRETVDFETPARRATSTIVVRPSRPSISLRVSLFTLASNWYVPIILNSFLPGNAQYHRVLVAGIGTCQKVLAVLSRPVNPIPGPDL